MVSILEKHHFNVVDANISNTKNNFALNTVHCVTDGKLETKNSMITEMQAALKRQKFYTMNLNKYTPTSEKIFKISPNVIILESNNKNDSMIEVICRERHGLLSLIAKTLLTLKVSINAAKIVTVGARAESTYWLNIDQKPLNPQQLKTLKNKLLEIL